MVIRTEIKEWILDSILAFVKGSETVANIVNDGGRETNHSQ